MNIVTFENYPKKLQDIKEKLIEVIESCNNEEQLASTLRFHQLYIDAVAHSKSIRYRQVTPLMMKRYFTKIKNKNKPHDDNLPNRPR